MTKKELILDSAHLHERKTLNPLVRLESTSLVKSLSAIYFKLLEEQVSARRTLKLVHAQLVMGALLLLGGVSLVVAILLCAWTILAVWQCKM